MFEKNIREIISKHSICVKKILIKENLLNKIDHLLSDLGFIGKNILIVSDENIKEISDKIGNNIKVNNCQNLILKNPKADDENIKIISKNCKNIDLILAVGSGTINDLCKYSSYQNNIPYVVFATAPSMNGYASANASILLNGHKKSLQACQAIAIYFDLDIISKAPKELIQSGIGDILCYWTCQFDWFLSNLISKTIFNNEVFEMLEPYQEKLFEFNANDLRNKDFIKLLCEILLLSGLAMYICKGSYPASQGEHLIAHFLEMKYPKILNQYFHGQQIGVTTLTMLQIQHKFLQAKKIDLKHNKIDLNYLIDLFDGDKKLANECIKEISTKYISEKELDKINLNLKEIQSKLSNTTISYERIIKIYDKFDLFKTANDLNISNKIYKEAVDNSFVIRNRLTSLDFNIIL